MKNTKKALLLSVMSLVLCLSMLVGTTFAWFTDSVSTGNNIIASGNLDVEMYYADKLETAAADWKDAANGAIFNYQLWEPGYTEVKYITIANEGSLALKYRLDVIPTVPAVAGEVNLGDVIDVYFIDGPAASAADFEDVQANWTKVGALSGLLDMAEGTATGILLPENGSANYTGPDAPKGSVTVGIALHMQESAGNEYMNKTVTDGFTVKLMATQLNWENDSFDNTYDESLELLEDGDMLVEENGIQYINHADGDKTLYLVTDKYTAADLVVPEGVTALGNYSFSYNSNVKNVKLASTVRSLGRAFDSSSVENVVLNEGLEKIDNRAFKAAANLKSVDIPTTVKVIEEGAFQQSGLTELVIPAGVEEIHKQALSYMPNLTTLEIKGNSVSFGEYVARACPNLATVKLAGYNVSFNGTSMAFSNAESGVSDKITITVANKAIEAKLRKAQGSATQYAVVVLDATVPADGIYTDGTNYYAYDNTGLANAINAEAPVTLGAGEYTMPSSNVSGVITISGSKDAVIDMTNGAYLEGATLTFKGVTIKTGTGKVNGNGADYAALYTKNATYTDCTFVGPMRVGRDGAKFVSCTFTELGNDYIWNYGHDVTFEGCTFNTEGKAILLYNDGGSEIANVVVKNCVFNATKGAKAGAIANQNCAAIEIHNYGNGAKLTTEGNTYDSNFSGEWRIKTYEAGRTQIFVNGTEYTTIAIDGKTMTIDADKNVTIN